MRDTTISANLHNILCPVSSSIDLKFSNKYPTNIFPNYMNSTHRRHHCAVMEYVPNEMYSTVIRDCTKESHCPLHHQNIIDASIGLNYWPRTSNFCHLQNLLQRADETVNVIVYGGSITLGRHVEGCCCNSELNPSSCYPHNTCIDILGDCTWHRNLFRWLKLYSKAKINHLDFSTGGFTSTMLNEGFYNDLQINNITKFTSNDIIFLDHSANDGSILTSTKERFEKFGKELDLLIDKIYDMSETYPTVIFLEMYPFAVRFKEWDFSNESSIIHSNRPYPHNNSYFPFDYVDIYRKIAINRGVTVWSYRNMIWSKISDSFEMKNSISYLRFMRNTLHDIHPGWPVHLFYSDLIANLILQEFTSCTAAGKSTSSPLIDRKEVKYPRCSSQKHPLVQYTKNQRNHYKLYGTYFMQPSDSWNEKLYFDNIVFNGERNIVNKTKDLCDATANNYSSVLSFEFDLSGENTQAIFSNNRMLLSVDYVKVMQDSRWGKADIYLCNRYMGTINCRADPSLDELNTKYSFQAVISPKDYICHGKTQSQIENPTIEIRRHCPQFSWSVVSCFILCWFVYYKINYCTSRIFIIYIEIEVNCITTIK